MAGYSFYLHDMNNFIIIYSAAAYSVHVDANKYKNKKLLVVTFFTASPQWWEIQSTQSQ